MPNFGSCRVIYVFNHTRGWATCRIQANLNDPSQRILPRQFHSTFTVATLGAKAKEVAAAWLRGVSYGENVKDP